MRRGRRFPATSRSSRHVVGRACVVLLTGFEVEHGISARDVRRDQLTQILCVDAWVEQSLPNERDEIVEFSRAERCRSLDQRIEQGLRHWRPCTEREI